MRPQARPEERPGAAPGGGGTQSHEQRRYAALLEWATRAGLAVTVVAFAAYVLGWLPAQVPLGRLPELWSLPVEQFLRASGGAAGWPGLVHWPQGEPLALAGIALLAGGSMAALLALVPGYLRRGDHAFAALCVAEVLVIALAASGWLATGH